MSLNTKSYVSSNGTATTALAPDNTENAITLEPDTEIITPTQSLSTPQAAMSSTFIETTSTSETDVSQPSQTASLSWTSGTSSQVVATSPSTSTSTESVGSTSSSLTSTSTQIIQTYMPTSASSMSHPPVSIPSAVLPESDPSYNTYSPMMIVSMVVAGIFISALLMIIMWLLWKRVIRSRRSNILYTNDVGRKPWTRDPQRLSMQQLRDSPGSFSWEEYHDGADDNSNLFHHSITSMTAYESGPSNELFDKQGYHETVEMRRERLDRLARRNHSPNGTIRNSIGSWTGLISPGTFSVPKVATSPRSILKMTLPSILKHNSFSTSPPTNISIANTHGMTRLVSPAQANIAMASSSDPIRSNAAKAMKVLGWEGSDGLIAVAKKEVRFGETQIKEFGRTPFASTTNSVAEDMKDLSDKL